MVKIVRLEPIAEEAVVQTNANILSALLAKELNVLESGGEEYVLLAMFTSKMAWKAFPPGRREKRTRGDRHS